MRLSQHKHLSSCLHVPCLGQDVVGPPVVTATATNCLLRRKVEADCH